LDTLEAASPGCRQSGSRKIAVPGHPACRNPLGARLSVTGYHRPLRISMGRIGDAGAFRCLATEQRHAEAIFLAFK
jgi:hypothetical protein